MEDSIGYELFLKRCLNESEFKIFIQSLEKILSNKERFCDISKKWTIFYRDNNPKNEELRSYLSENLPQPFITIVGRHYGGPFLDVVGIGLRKRIQGEEQIKQYVNKMSYYAQRHISTN